jgi:type II secretory pathway pseudopilin PulG
MKNINNEKGITLLEVLLSITILSIVLLSIISIFPQMGLMNKQNEDKTQAVNTAKQLLNIWKVDEKVIKALKENDTSEFPPGLTSSSGDFYTFSIINPNAEIKIWKNAEPSFEGYDPIKAHQIHIEVKNDINKIISETYGYVIVK